VNASGGVSAPAKSPAESRTRLLNTLIADADDYAEISPASPAHIAGAEARSPAESLDSALAQDADGRVLREAAAPQLHNGGWRPLPVAALYHSLARDCPRYDRAVAPLQAGRTQRCTRCAGGDGSGRGRPALDRRGAAQRRRSAGARRSAVVSHSEASLADAARVHLANAERTARNLMALTTTRRRRADASRSLSGCSGRRAHLSRRLRPRRGNERAESDAVELAAALTVAADIARRDAEVVHVESSVGCRVLPCERKSSQRRAAARSGRRSDCSPR
jgi:hypothetical protein